MVKIASFDGQRMLNGKMQRCAYDRMLVKLPSSLPIAERDGWFAAFKSSKDLHPKTSRSSYDLMHPDS